VEHSFACGVTERNIGQSLYLCFDSAGFCVGTRHGPALNRELFKGRRSLEPVGSRTITVEHVELQVG
jgi:hypothetical protein